MCYLFIVKINDFIRCKLWYVVQSRVICSAFHVQNSARDKVKQNRRPQQAVDEKLSRKWASLITKVLLT